MKHIIHSAVTFTLLIQLFGSGAALYAASSHPEETRTNASPISAGGTFNSLEPAGLKPIPSRGAWLGPDGKPLPLQNDEEIIEFLQTATVVSSQKVGSGINGTAKVLLEKDGVRMHAAFRNVRIDRKNIKMRDGSTRSSFRDDCVFELAAYRLSKLLGLDNVPLVVKRKIGGKTGTLQIWIENAIMEKKRLKEKIQPPNRSQWRNQVQVMRLFDNLIYNEDRNQGNVLFDSNWKLWMIDHTRSFRHYKEPKNPQLVLCCPRTLWENLKKLDKDLLMREFKGILRGDEIKGLLARRDRLVQYIGGLIDKKGEGTILF
ncbi:hypothetical protein MYX75_06165 [Acidobacteria bacterium AH-259-A15]|nr:hypothetical protein [Acidobacteria bacterium AH-259-A15]